MEHRREAVMDYTELVKKLRNRRECLQTGLDLDIDYPLLRDAADAIEWLVQKMQQPRWIPVEEKLPEPDKIVNITDGTEVGEGWYNGYWHTPLADIDEHGVTHWQPLPKPPKEE
jgi:hypothetical protein